MSPITATAASVSGGSGRRNLSIFALVVPEGISNSHTRTGKAGFLPDGSALCGKARTLIGCVLFPDCEASAREGQVVASV